VIKGRVEAREEARAQYDAARLEGHTAGLVEQERSNVFTQCLGNIPPATDVNVELTIDQPLHWLPGLGWEWRFPTVVAPRYLGSEGTVPDASRVTMDVVNGVTSPTASVILTIGEDPFIAPTSPTHSIVVTNRSVALAAGAALDRDIVIRWTVPQHSPGCAIRTMRPAVSQLAAGDTAYGLLTIVPPTAHGERFPRDLVLLLDVSGSMSGQPSSPHETSTCVRWSRNVWPMWLRLHSGDEEGAVRLLPLHRPPWSVRQYVRARGGTAHDTLTALHEARDPVSPYVFPHRVGPNTGQPVMDIKNGFRAALELAGIDDFTWHDLRHCFASWLMMRGASLRSVAELLGHTSM
jgi:hypothetical protein